MYPGRAGNDEKPKYPPANFDRTRPPPGLAALRAGEPRPRKRATRTHNRHDATELNARSPFATPTMQPVRCRANRRDARADS